MKTHALDAETVHYEWNNTLAPRLEVEPGDTASDSVPAGPPPADAYTAEVVTTGFSDAPGPPETGAHALGGTPARFPALGTLVLAVLAAAAIVVRRLRQDR